MQPSYKYVSADTSLLRTRSRMIYEYITLLLNLWEYLIINCTLFTKSQAHSNDR